MTDHRIDDADLAILREELEARRNGFKLAWPGSEINAVIQRLDGLLERLPKPHYVIEAIER